MTKVNERDIVEAIKIVENGEKITKAARDYGIYASTLSRRLKGARFYRNTHDNN
jgi:transposase-like protein